MQINVFAGNNLHTYRINLTLTGLVYFVTHRSISLTFSDLFRPDRVDNSIQPEHCYRIRMERWNKRNRLHRIVLKDTVFRLKLLQASPA